MRDIGAFNMLNKIQPREYSMGGGVDDFSYISDDDLNLLNLSRNDDGHWLNAYYDNPDNQWNRDNGFAFVSSQVSLFPLHFWGVLFYYLAGPTTKHLTNFI